MTEETTRIMNDHEQRGPARLIEAFGERKCATNGFTPRHWLWVILSNLVALNCFGANLSFVGTGYYNVSGNTVVLQADEILNNDFGGFSGTIRLELWESIEPYLGSPVRNKLRS